MIGQRATRGGGCAGPARVVAVATGVVLLCAGTASAGDDPVANPSSAVPAAAASAGTAAPAAAPSGPSAGGFLGRGHVSLTGGAAYFSHDVEGAWGVDHDTFLGLAIYVKEGTGSVYGGGEIAWMTMDGAANDRGETIRGFDLLVLEVNAKWAPVIRSGFGWEAGFGAAGFWADGEEVEVIDGVESGTNLADLGFGAQGFAGLDWRWRRLLIGAGVKFQWLYDVIDVNYSNFKVTGQVGWTF